ncbi:MAG: EFR1 family ferrodoxin [Elusimicrobiota bacterium]
MQTTIYYFSGTGNSFKVAKEISALIGNAELIPIPKVINEEADLSADRIGIVFPVYVWGMPLIVADFVKKMKAAKDKYIFGVVTYGGFPAGTLVQLARLLKNKGMKLSAGYGIKMPGNYTPMYGAIPEAKQNLQFAGAGEKTKIIAEAVKDAKPGPVEKSNFLANLFFSSILYNAGISHMRGADKNFRVQDKCNGCGICYKVCPAGNIKLENSRPVWNHKCEQCMACLQWCPVEAIQYGKKTEKRKRYHHPDIKIIEMYYR